MDWQAMVFLGAYHGINPGMGWLFAVALGMQRGSARGVWGALPPIALGHAAAVGVVLLTVGLAQVVERLTESVQFFGSDGRGHVPEPSPSRRAPAGPRPCRRPPSAHPGAAGAAVMASD